MSNEICNNEFDFSQLVRSVSTVSTASNTIFLIPVFLKLLLYRMSIIYKCNQIYIITSRETIISEISAVEYPIPSAGFRNFFRKTNGNISKSIYQSNSEPTCIAKFESKGPQSSSITRHIINKHKFMKKRRKF